MSDEPRTAPATPEPKDGRPRKSRKIPAAAPIEQAADAPAAIVEAKPGVVEAASGTPTLSPAELAPTIEAVLLTLDKPITAGRLAVGLGLVKGDADGESLRPAPAAIREAVDLLNAQYQSTGRSFRIEQVAGGYRVMTIAPLAGAVAAFHGRRERHALSRAAVETLAIIAYKQPLTRATLEAIRGVACGEVLRSLIERRLITITGRADELGRPMLYGTTKKFLEAFGLAGLKDLPSVADFRPPEDAPPAPAQTSAPAQAHEPEPTPAAAMDPAER